MKTRPFLLALFVLVAVTSSESRAFAGGPSNRAAARRAIEGTWRLDFLPGQGSTRRFYLLLTFGQGGALTETKSAFWPGITTPGLGTWRHAGGRRFEYVYRKIMYTNQGALFGIFRVSGALVLSEDGTTITEEGLHGEQFDPAEEELLFELPNVRGEGKRLPIKALP